jgi:hypothetical protein
MLRRSTCTWKRRFIMAGYAAPILTTPTKSETSGHGSAVAVYDNHRDAEQAIRTLANSGFDMQKLSIVGRDYATEEGVVGYYNAGDRMKAWGKTGAFWGGLWGMLFGSALFVIPGIGPLFAAGPLVTWIVGALEGATVVGGMSALGAGLFSIGIPKDSVLSYETQIKAGKFVIIAHGTSDEVEKGRTALAGATHYEGAKHACCE